MKKSQGDRLANWAFGLQGAIENVVQENFPGEVHRWPLLRTFNFDCYSWRDEYWVLILKDKLSGIPAGGKIDPIGDDAPEDAPSEETLVTWIKFLTERLGLRVQDAFAFIPINYPARNNALEEFKQWSEDEKALWHNCVVFAVRQHYYRIHGFDKTHIAAVSMREPITENERVTEPDMTRDVETSQTNPETKEIIDVDKIRLKDFFSHLPVSQFIRFIIYMVTLLFIVSSLTYRFNDSIEKILNPHNVRTESEALSLDTSQRKLLALVYENQYRTNKETLTIIVAGGDDAELYSSDKSLIISQELGLKGSRQDKVDGLLRLLRKYPEKLIGYDTPNRMSVVAEVWIKDEGVKYFEKHLR